MLFALLQPHSPDALTRRTHLLFVLLGGLALSCSSDPGVTFNMSDETERALKLLPPDADFIAMVNPGQMREIDAIDPFGLFAVPDYILADDAENLPPLSFLYAFGLNPEQDFSQFFLSHSASSQEDAFSILAYPTISSDSLRKRIGINAVAPVDSVVYNEQMLYAVNQNVLRGYLAFVDGDNGVMAAAPQPLVEAMIDRLRFQKLGLQSNTSAYRLIGEASQGRTAWFVIRKVSKTDINLPLDEAIAASFEALTEALNDVVIALTVKSGTLNIDILLYPFTESVTEAFADLTEDFLDNMRASQKLSEEEIEVLAGARVLLERNAVRITLKADTHLFKRSE